jgi:hypothetical protein
MQTNAKSNNIWQDDNTIAQLQLQRHSQSQCLCHRIQYVNTMLKRAIEATHDAMNMAVAPTSCSFARTTAITERKRST